LIWGCPIKELHSFQADRILYLHSGKYSIAVKHQKFPTDSNIPHMIYSEIYVARIVEKRIQPLHHLQPRCSKIVKSCQHYA
jgi:hypothetical protein